MPISVMVDPIDLDIALIIAEDLGPKAQSAALAEHAQEQIADARATNKEALRSDPGYDVYVDGRKAAALETVRPDGVIVAEFHLLADMFGWIDLQLITHSPVKTGRYRRSHLLFADGNEVDPDATGALPDALEYVYLNSQPYARRIEEGLSKQAVDGVYQVVAVLAARRFGNLARIQFQYRRLAGAAKGGRDDRQPAIVITL